MAGRSGSNCGERRHRLSFGGGFQALRASHASQAARGPVDPALLEAQARARVTERPEVSFRLCDSTWERITERHGDAATAADFSPAERVVVLVWTLTGIVGNGGIESLLSSDLPGDPGYLLSREAFKTIGCEAAAQALADVAALFPGNKIPGDQHLRRTLLAEHPEATRDAISGRFFELEDAITARLAEYIRKEGL